MSLNQETIIRHHNLPLPQGGEGTRLSAILSIVVMSASAETTANRFSKKFIQAGLVFQDHTLSGNP
jgi:hypothetical protein